MSETELPVPKLAVRLFGGAAIEQGGAPLADRAAHRHVIALLAVLATARGRLMSRDKVVALLWPDGEPEAVRHRLNVLLYDVRRILGRSAIVSVNDAIRLDPEAVWVDVVRFAGALRRGAIDEAVALYRGEFLDGFHLDDAREFDEWASGERHRFAGDLQRGLEQAAARAAAAGDHESAIRHWRHLAHLDPLGARPALGLMRALAAAGDHDGAERAGAAHSSRRVEAVGEADAAVEALRAELRARAPVPAAAPAAGRVPGRGAVEDADPATSFAAPSRSRPRARFTAGAAAVIAVFLLVVWPRVARQRAAEGSPADAGVVVVFPFSVRGAANHAYLAEGLAELLSITLDGAGQLRTADPHAVLALARRERTEGVDPDAARRLAAQFGAGHFILGSLVETGGRMDARASLYQAEGRLQASAVGRSDDGDLVSVVDTLTRQLLAALYPSGVERLTRLAVATSASLSALKAFLEGEAHVRAGNHAQAVDAYRQATAADSAFALAWYRLAVTLEATLQPRAARDAVAGAVRHASRLPERDRMLLEGWQDYVNGRADAAEARYRRIVDRYPNEVEAWLQVGEIAFHHAASRGQPISVARPAFQRVLSLDPDHEAAHVHLARIAGQARDTAELARHTAYLVERRPGTGVALEMAALEAFATGDRAALATLRPRFEATDSYTVLALLMNLFHAGDVAGMRWCADLLREPARPVEVQVAGHVVRALLDVSQGDVRAAFEAVARAEALDPARGLEARAQLVTMPFVSLPPAEVTRVRDRLAGAVDQRVPESFFLPDEDRVRPAMRRYLLALLEAQTGRPDRALRLAGELEAWKSPASDADLGRDLAAGVRAEVERGRGDPGAALQVLDRIRDRPSYQLVLPSPFEPRVRERYLKARLLAELGRAADARPLASVIGSRSLYDLPYARRVP